MPVVADEQAVPAVGAPAGHPSPGPASNLMPPASKRGMLASIVKPPASKGGTTTSNGGTVTSKGNTRASRFSPAASKLKPESNEVLECHRGTGGDSFIMKVAVASVEHLQEMIDRLVPYGITTTTIVLSSPVKRRVIEIG